MPSRAWHQARRSLGKRRQGARSIAWVALLAGATLALQLSPMGEEQAVLEVNPSELHFEAPVDGPPPEPQGLTISNDGETLMSWEASTEADWIVLGATEGTLSAGRSINLQVLIDPVDLDVGQHTGTIVIEAPQAQGTPVVVEAELSVTRRPLPNEFISYTSDKRGSYDIWVVKPDGSDPRRITQLPGDEGAHSWSPNGKQVVFSRQVNGDPEHLWIMNADGSHLRQLTDGPGEETEPAWSPNGGRIAFVRIAEDSNDDGEFNSWLDDSEIWVQDLETGDRHRLAPNSPSPYRYLEEDNCSPSTDWLPTWSSDGSQIAFGSNRRGAPDRCASDIWIVKADGTNLQRLPDDGMWVWGPSWSVNNEIAFVAFHRQTTEDDIWVVGTNGSHLRNVTSFQDDEQFPTWSPDGSKIAYNRQGDIWVVNLQEDKSHALTNTSQSNEFVAEWVQHE